MAAAAAASEAAARDDDDENLSIRVYVRVRPPLNRELERGFRPATQINPSGKTITLLMKPEPKTFLFDHVGGPETPQDHIFAKVGRAITEKCVTGYNATIFAYGQTGSGKTFTIQGPLANTTQVPETHRVKQVDARGLMPRVFEYMFSLIEQAERASAGRLKYMCQASFLEIYNDRIYDLLTPASEPLNIRESTERGVYVEGVVEAEVHSAADALRLMDTGTLNRTVGETSMNRESSRSHSVYILLVHSSYTDPATGLTTNRASHFNLIDLAGSERQSQTGTAGGRLQEAAAINQSLSALGNVIVSLVDIAHGKQRHIPYRDSRLTFLLKDSLGGNSLTYLVACVSPSQDAIGETLSTLMFAQRAKKIRNRALLNEGVTGSADALKKENARLRRELQALHEKLGGGGTGGGPGRPLDANESRPPSPRPNGGAPGGGGDDVASPREPATFDEAMFRQTLKREREARDEAERARKELAALQALNEKLEKQRQSTRMMLSFRDKSIDQMRQQLERLRKNEAAPVTESEKLLGNEVVRLQKEVLELQEQLKNHPDVVAKGLLLADLEAKVAEYKRLHNETVAHLRVLEARLAAYEDKRDLSPPADLETKLATEAQLRQRLGEVQKHNEQLTNEVLRLREAGPQADSKKNEEALLQLEVERQDLEEKLLRVQQTLEDERAQNAEAIEKLRAKLEEERSKKAEEDRARIAELEQQLEAARGLTKQLKTFLERAGEREKQLKDKLAALQDEIARGREQGATTPSPRVGISPRQPEADAAAGAGAAAAAAAAASLSSTAATATATVPATPGAAGAPSTPLASASPSSGPPSAVNSAREARESLPALAAAPAPTAASASPQAAGLPRTTSMSGHELATTPGGSPRQEAPEGSVVSATSGSPPAALPSSASAASLAARSESEEKQLAPPALPPPAMPASLFGVALAESPMEAVAGYPHPLPLVLVMLGRALRTSGGLEKEGVFRVSAAQASVEAARKSVDTEGVLPPSDDAAYVAANLISAFFRELPTPLLSPLDPAEVVVCQDTNAAAALLQKLPPLQLAVFQWLLDLAVDLHERVERTRMGAKNFAVVMAPSLFPVPTMDGDDAGYRSMLFIKQSLMFLELAALFRRAQRQQLQSQTPG